MSLRSVKIFFLLQATCLLFSCASKRISPLVLNQQEPVTVLAQELSITYMPPHKRVPTHLVINKSVRYQFSQSQIPESFSQELIIDPLMHQTSFVAQVQKMGKTLRKYPAKTVQSPHRAGRAMLSIVVPFLKPEEEVVITSSYNWMDPRLVMPVFMEEAEATLASKITIDVPYGIKLRHKAAYLGSAITLEPTSIALEKTAWGTSDNRHGKRYIFEHNLGPHNNAKKVSHRQQLFLAFDAPAERDKNTLFESWEAVSNYLYSRLDRYDLSSNAIRDFSVSLTKDSTDDIEKIKRVLYFLSNNIEMRNAFEPYLDQDAQPANKILSTRAGSALGKVVLGSALLSSLNIEANIVAVSDPDKNPRILDFFSPMLFSKPVLAIAHNSGTYYYDPLQNFDRLEQVPAHLQGQQALLVKASGSQFFTLPYESAEKNTISYFYDLSINNAGFLEGQFSLDLEGIKAREAKNILGEQSALLSASALQNKLQTGSTLRWQKASFNPAEQSVGLSFNGIFSPRLLARSSHSGFELPIKDIFEPIFLPLINHANQSHSSISSLEASLQIPNNFKFAQTKPLNFLIDHNGLRARFLVTFENQTVVFKGESMISLPINAERDYKLALPNDLLTVVEKGAQPEDPREAILSKPPENS
jgi:hypothetical protein